MLKRNEFKVINGDTIKKMFKEKVFMPKKPRQRGKLNRMYNFNLDILC